MFLDFISEVEESLLSAIESCRFEIYAGKNNLALDLSPYADLASSIAFRLAPVLNRKPASIAAEIHEALPKEYMFVKRAEQAGPYLNFFVNSRFLDQVLDQAIADNCWSGRMKEKAIVEHTSPAETGKLLNVDLIVTGTLIEAANSSAELNARVFNASTGEIISALALELELNEKMDDISKINYQDETQENATLIQVAILLDTSNSMDGLIMQANTQLWKIANEMGAMKKNGKTPTVEIALYEYGNQGLAVTKDYTRQILGFSANMDKVFKELFSMSTNGGEEFAGYVIRDAGRNLKWNNSKDTRGEQQQQPHFSAA